MCVASCRILFLSLLHCMWLIPFEIIFLLFWHWNRLVPWRNLPLLFFHRMWHALFGILCFLFTQYIWLRPCKILILFWFGSCMILLCSLQIARGTNLEETLFCCFTLHMVHILLPIILTLRVAQILHNPAIVVRTLHAACIMQSPVSAVLTLLVTTIL